MYTLCEQALDGAPVDRVLLEIGGELVVPASSGSPQALAAMRSAMSVGSRNWRGVGGPNEYRNS